MWTNLVADDIDNDGDIDFIAGNCGWNEQFKSSVNEPMTIYAGDFDNNGRMDAITCYYIQGKSYPMASRDELLDQIVSLKKKFLKYRDYAGATVESVLGKEKMAASAKYYCYQQATCILLNDGSDKFSLKPLPAEAQFSKVYGIATGDFDQDGKKDILLTGNFMPYRVQLGRCDASLGTLLKGDGVGGFEPVPAWRTGLYANGDIRRMVIIDNALKEKMIILARNNEAVQVLKMK
jgi:hypothetical protein